MKIIASVAVSLDGYIDDCSPQRLMLSSPEDWASVYALRAQCDAILVGAGTLRADNPSLTIKDEILRRDREMRGQSPDIMRVTITHNGDLDPSLKFFAGQGRPIVFAQSPIQGGLSSADVVAGPVTAGAVVTELEKRGVRTLLVEGGSQTLGMFFQEDAVDELRLAVAPFFVGDQRAHRMISTGIFPAKKTRRMELIDIEKLGDMAVMHYKCK